MSKIEKKYQRYVRKENLNIEQVWNVKYHGSSWLDIFLEYLSTIELGYTNFREKKTICQI